jgi:hypothetical protein
VSVENCRYGKAKGKRQEARVKRVWAILHFFTQFSFIVFTYLDIKDGKIWIQRDLTEEGIANELVELGVAKSDIVLAFRAPHIRQFTDFAQG